MDRIPWSQGKTHGIWQIQLLFVKIFLENISEFSAFECKTDPLARRIR